MHYLDINEFLIPFLKVMLAYLSIFIKAYDSNQIEVVKIFHLPHWQWFNYFLFVRLFQRLLGKTEQTLAAPSSSCYQFVTKSILKISSSVWSLVFVKELRVGIKVSRLYSICLHTLLSSNQFAHHCRPVFLLTLFIPVNRGAGGYTDLPLNINISETIRVSSTSTCTFFKKVFNRLSHEMKVERICICVCIWLYSCCCLNFMEILEH